MGETIGDPLISKRLAPNWILNLVLAALKMPTASLASFCRLVFVTGR